jgi:predicted membrane metal-binding protein
VIYQSLPPVEAGLLGGTLLGDESGFEREFWNLLKNSDLVHLVVVSGTNMILVSVMYWAQLLGRKYDIFRGLIFSVLIIVLAWPQSLYEVGFWLSFGAFVGVVTSPWRGILGSSFWISLWISPIMALFFGKINLVSPISNLLVIITVQVITVVGFLGSIVGIIIPILGKLILWSIWPLLKYFVVVAEVIGVGSG